MNNPNENARGEAILGDSPTSSMPIFLWESSDVCELPEANHQLALMIQSNPKFHFFWTTGATALPHGKVALNDKQHVLVIRRHTATGQSARSSIDLLSPSWGIAQPAAQADPANATDAAGDGAGDEVGTPDNRAPPQGAEEPAEVVWTDEEKKVFFIAPHCNLSTDAEIFQRIVCGVKDTQRRESLMQVGQNSGRLTAKALKDFGGDD